MIYKAHCKHCRNRSKIQEKIRRQNRYLSGTSPLTSLDWYRHFNNKDVVELESWAQAFIC